MVSTGDNPGRSAMLVSLGLVVLTALLWIIGQVVEGRGGGTGVSKTTIGIPGSEATGLLGALGGGGARSTVLDFFPAKSSVQSNTHAATEGHPMREGRRGMDVHAVAEEPLHAVARTTPVVADYCTYHEEFLSAKHSLTSTFRGNNRELGGRRDRGMDGDAGGTPLEKVFPMSPARAEKNYQVTLDDPPGGFKFPAGKVPRGWKEGESYEGRTCSHKRVVRCSKSPSTTAESVKGKKKGKALFIYMMHGWDSDDRPGEWTNVAHFLQFGVLPANTPTQLYDGVDYVFIRSSPNVLHEVEACRVQPNIILMWLPPVPCDLCGHRRVLETLGFKPEYGESTRAPNYDEWPYKTVTFMNSGVRGPLMAPGAADEAHWLDVLGMAGQQRRSVWYKDHSSFKTVGVSAFSWEAEFHAQSYFLSVPLSALNYYWDKFLIGCKQGKHACIFSVEVKSVGPLHAQRKGFTFHSFLQNFTFGGDMNMKQLGNSYGFGGHNPTYQYTDACKGLFMKFGGGAWQFQPVPSRRSVLHLSAAMKADQQSSPALDANKKKVIRSLFDGSRLSFKKKGTRRAEASEAESILEKCRFFREPHQDEKPKRESNELLRRKAEWDIARDFPDAKKENQA